LTVWECETKNVGRIERRLSQFLERSLLDTKAIRKMSVTRAEASIGASFAT
jgi:hypothetical protein